jgi:hypothetical protein
MRQLITFAGCLLLLTAVLAPSTSFARGKESPRRIDEFTFRATGADGYGVSFDGYRFGSDRGSLSVRASKDGKSATYYGRKITGRGHEVAGSVGPLGSLDARFHATSVSHRRFPCAAMTIRRGTFAGAYDFDHGYTRVTGHRAEGKMVTYRLRDCSPPPRHPSHQEKRQVVLTACLPGNHTFFAFAGDGARPAYYLAEKTAREGNVQVIREVFSAQPPDTFSYDHDLGTATLTPRMPLTGTGQYSDRALTGNLSATFLDDPNPMPLISPRARLKRTAGLSAVADCANYGEIVVIYRGGAPRTVRVPPSAAGARLAAALARVQPGP